MIGIFDSGAGGLSVWKELITIMPSENYFYISDAAYCPYGPKSKKMILERATSISRFLIERGAEIIVVACNTATAAAIKELRQLFDIPFIGMEPAVKPAASMTKTGTIGVLATQGTFKGSLYRATSEKYALNKRVRIVEQVGDGLVELVEEGRADSPEAEQLVKKYIDPMLKADADCVVLGCTHYPFLQKAIRKVSSDKLHIINPAPAVAKRARQMLENVRQTKNSGTSENKSPEREFQTIIATTGSNPEVLEKLSDGITDSLLADCLLNESQIGHLKKNFFVSLDI